MEEASGGLFKKFGQSFKAGSIVFAEHEPGKYSYLIQTGKVRLTKLIGEREKIIDVIGEGDFFGEMAVLEKVPRSATAVAYTDLDVLCFDKSSFEMILQVNSKLSARFITTYSLRVFEARQRLKILHYKDEEKRVLYTLSILSRQKNVNKDSGKQKEIEGNIRDIASWCALNPEQVDMILSKYRANNRIQLKDGKIIIENISEFERMI